MSKKWLIAIFTACWLCWPWQEIDNWFLGKHSFPPLWYILGWESDVLACGRCGDFPADKALIDIKLKAERIETLKTYCTEHKETCGDYYKSAIFYCDETLRAYGEYRKAIELWQENKTEENRIYIDACWCCCDKFKELLTSVMLYLGIMPADVWKEDKKI